jgi:nucleotide-binding universal stress UspA family protein
MPNRKRILVAVDGSEASRRTVNYVADIVSGNPAAHVGVVHLELPPRMLEWGGSENPDVEDKVSAERAAAYREMENEKIANGKAALKDLLHPLTAKGIDVTAVFVQFEEPLNWKHVAHHLLKTAKERDYGTIVAGRHSFSWLESHHVATELIREGEGMTIWVVE